MIFSETIPKTCPSRRLYPPACTPYGLDAELGAKTQYSNIPVFHNSNWGEAPRFK